MAASSAACSGSLRKASESGISNADHMIKSEISSSQWTRRLDSVKGVHHQREGRARVLVHLGGGALVPAEELHHEVWVVRELLD